MKHTGPLTYTDEHLTVSCDGGIAIFTLRQDAFFLAYDLGAYRRLASLLDEAQNSSAVDSVLIVNSEGSVGPEEHQGFLKRVANKSLNYAPTQFGDQYDGKILYERATNTFIRLIFSIIKFRKIVVAGLQGPISTPFFGLSLACDFRLGSESMKLVPSHVELGLPPGNALCYLLPKFVGQGKATEMLLSRTPIDANAALSLGLVNRVLTDHGFVGHCNKVSEELGDIPANTVVATRGLLHSWIDDLKQFSENEHDVMLASMRSCLSEAVMT